MIRKAELEDADGIRKVARVTWKATYQGLIPGEIQNRFLEAAYSDQNLMIRIEKTIFFVAEQGRSIIGFANARVKDGCAELSAIYVLPAHQGCGVGEKLLQAVVNRLTGLSRMVVDVEKGNCTGECFYQAKGFRVIREFEDDFMGYKLKTRRMQLSLQDGLRGDHGVSIS